MFGEQFVLLPGALVFCSLGVPLALRGPSAVVLNQLLHRGKNTAELRRVPDGRRHKRLCPAELGTGRQVGVYVQSTVIKRSVVIGGRKTSVSLEDAFWRSLKELASAKKMTMSGLIANIEQQKQSSNLSSALRLFVLDSFKSRVTEPLERTADETVSGRNAHSAAGRT